MSQGPGEDVESYTLARWSDLVGTLVALGADVPAAERAARSACVRSRRSWAREQRSGDVDVLVFGELLAAWGWPTSRPGPDADTVARALVAEGRVSEHAAERVTGGDPSGALPDEAPADDQPAYRGTAPMAAIRDDLRRRRRRTTRLVAVGAVVAAAVAGLVLVLSADPEPPEPRPLVVNPLPLAWWSQGTLHLARSEVSMPELAALAQAGRGASYVAVVVDDDGAVLQVDGTVAEPERIGRTEPGAPVVGSPDGRAAWVDVSDGVPTVVVWDTDDREVVARLPRPAVGSAPEVVALDGDVVYLASGTTASRWALGDEADQLLADRVLDAAGDVRLVVARPTEVEAPLRFYAGRFLVDPTLGLGSTLSPGGLVAASWSPGEPGLSLVGSGANLTTVPLGLPADAGLVEARFAPDGGLVLVVTDGAQAPLSLVTCVLQTGACDEVGRAPSGEPVVLAR